MAAMIAGCSDDSVDPSCQNCDSWTQLVDDLGRQGSSHPINASFVVYGTIHKTPGAPDESRESDEDLWLLWRGSPDPSQWVRWQLTGDELGEGDNFHARWSPSGNKIAFVHSDAAGKFQIWSLDITLPPGQPPSAAFDPSGTPVLLLANGRDPSWLGETAILFSRDDKIYLSDVGRGAPSEIQVTFDPPTFISSTSYSDRNPNVSSDGVAIFSTTGREETADVLIAAYEVHPGSPPETTATTAFIGLQAPDVPRIVYPLTERGDTLVTSANEDDPYVVLHSLPSTDATQVYLFGAQRDSQLLPAGENSYCDTLLIQAVNLSAGEIDTVRFYFKPARGSLLIASGRPFTTVRWERVDDREISSEELLEGNCTWTTYDCVMSYKVSPQGQILEGVLEPLYVIGRTNTGDVDTVVTQVAPAETSVVKLFCDADTCGCIPPATPAGFAGNWTPPSRMRNPSWKQSARGIPGGGGGQNVRAVVGDYSIWRIDLANPERPTLHPIVASDFPLQSPVLSPSFGGIRYLAYTSNPDGPWALYVQKLDAAFQPDGAPLRIETPGTSDNFICDRNIFHPSWVGGSSPGNVRLLVTMTDCPDNGFEGSGIDDDPWSQGELNVWQVVVPF
jgi:hypothetical protein